MVRNLVSGISSLLIIILISSCTETSQYEKLVQEELATGIKYDSIFLNINFGMTRKDFYTKCWEMNKQKLIQQGPGNLSVEYKLDTGLRSTAFMRFYPAFEDEKIYEMPIAFTYESWAPWNKELATDSLLLDVKEMMERWYGPGFMKMKSPKHEDSFVKVNGNRRIMVFRYDHITVKVLVTDLFTKNKILKREKENAEQ